MFHTFTTINTLQLGKIFTFRSDLLVNEITQITAHDWNVIHGHKRFVVA